MRSVQAGFRVRRLRAVLGAFALVGFSGARGGCVGVSAAVSAVPAGAGVFVGCAAGVDASVRAAFPFAQVFQAASFAASSWAGRLALRSQALVRGVVAGGGVLVVLPSGACPVGCVAGSSWRGSGSGSWGSAALAVGAGGAVLVRVGVGVGVPVWVSGRGRRVVGGWWFVPAQGLQGTLF